jgi:hypothetical protein
MASLAPNAQAEMLGSGHHRTRPRGYASLLQAGPAVQPVDRLRYWLPREKSSLDEAFRPGYIFLPGLKDEKHLPPPFIAESHEYLSCAEKDGGMAVMPAGVREAFLLRAPCEPCLLSYGECVYICPEGCCSAPLGTRDDRTDVRTRDAR